MWILIRSKWTCGSCFVRVGCGWIGEFNCSKMHTTMTSVQYSLVWIWWTHTRTSYTLQHVRVVVAFLCEAKEKLVHVHVLQVFGAHLSSISMHFPLLFIVHNPLWTRCWRSFTRIRSQFVRFTHTNTRGLSAFSISGMASEQRRHRHNQRAMSLLFIKSKWKSARSIGFILHTHTHTRRNEEEENQ